MRHATCQREGRGHCRRSRPFTAIRAAAIRVVTARAGATRANPRRRTAAIIAIALSAGFSGTLSSIPAFAAHGQPPHANPGDPVIPGQDQIDKARADAQQRKTAADRIQVSLDAADKQLHVLESRAGQAVEAFNAAAALSLAAQKVAADAQHGLTVAKAAKAEADRRLGEFAAQTYRNGPDMARITALMHVSTLRELTDSEHTLRMMASMEASALAGAQAAERTANEWQAKASTAAAKAADAAGVAAGARDAAQAAASTEQSEVARISGQRETLLAQLAQAQGIAVSLERQREQGLQEQAARAAAAAREAAQRATLGQKSGLSGGSHPAQTWGALPNGAGAVHTMLNYIYAQLGKPYVWGGAGPDVFDCSGLAMRGLEAAGWQFPHPAQWQYLAMHPVAHSELRPGDLVFWAENDANPHTIYHEAIYIGDDRIIQAPKPGGVVEIQSLWVNGTPSYYGRP